MNRLLKLLLIRQDERSIVFYFTALFFIIGLGAAMGKTSAEALFFKRFGIEYLPLMFVFLGFLLVVVSFIYAAYADKLRAEKFFNRFFIALLLILLATWALINYSESSLSLPLYFLVYEASSEILIIHASLYLSQNLCSSKTKRLSPIIFSGTQFGIVCGGLLVAVLAPMIGTSTIILVWCLFIFSAMILMNFWHKSKGASPYFYNNSKKNSLNKTWLSIRQGISFSRKSKLLRALSLSFFFLVICFYLLYYLTNQIYTGYFETEESLTAFLGLLTALTGSIGLLLQIFVSNRLIDKWGVQKVNLIFPISVSFSFVALLIAFKLPVAILGSFIKDTLNASFNGPARNIMIDVLPKNIQGRARAVTTGIILPFALLACASILLFAQTFDNIYYFLIPGILASFCFLFYSLRMNKVYLRTLIQHLKEEVYLPTNLDSLNKNLSFTRYLEDNILHLDDKVALSSAKILLDVYPKIACKAISKRLEIANIQTADQMIKIITQYDHSVLIQYLQYPEKFPKIDAHLESTILSYLFLNKIKFAKQFIQKALQDDNPRLCATGILAVYIYQQNQWLEEANAKWLILMMGSKQQQLTALTLVRLLEDVEKSLCFELVKMYQMILLELFEDDLLSSQMQSLSAITNWRIKERPVAIATLHKQLKQADPKMREMTVTSACCFELNELLGFITDALNDGHLSVRLAAFSLLFKKSISLDEIAQHWMINETRLTPTAQQFLFQLMLDKGLSEMSLNKISAAQVLLTREYYDAMQILKAMQGEHTIYFLLYRTLLERLQHSCHLLLSSLEKTEDVQIISVVRAAINSANSNLIATACEALKNMKNIQVNSLLIDVLQDDFELKKDYMLMFNDRNQVLNWCFRQDEWLYQLAEKAMAINHD